ncbi:2-dehydro-3-deoxygalactonokinase, partial [Klebsiella pneumoniae]
SAQIREILISESAWEEMTCLFAPSLGSLAATSVSDYLSGLLIGAEVATFSERYRASRVVLVGEHSLNARYQQAMAARGLAVSCCSGEAAFLSGIARMIDGQD